MRRNSRRITIQVNAIAPGFIKTRFSRALWDNEDINQRIIERTPRRDAWVNQRKSSGAAVFLASDESSFMTGDTLIIDGGVTLATS